LVVRYEYHAENFLDLLRLGCAIILLRFFLRWLIVRGEDG
jgi:hypothetical protein